MLAGTGNPGRSELTDLTFAEGGPSIVQHYLTHRDAEFEYCVEGPSEVASLSLTVEVELGISVTIALL